MARYIIIDPIFASQGLEVEGGDQPLPREGEKFTWEELGKGDNDDVVLGTRIVASVEHKALLIREGKKLYVSGRRPVVTLKELP